MVNSGSLGTSPSENDIETYRKNIIHDPSPDKHRQSEEWEFCRDHFEHFCRTWYWIAEKPTDARAIRRRLLLELNPTQRQYAANQTTYDIILKARQVGISTYKLAEGLHKFCFFPDQHGLLIAHRNDATVELFSRLKLAYDLLPDFLQPPLQFRQSTILEAKTFPEHSPNAGQPSGSKFQIMTAEGYEPGRAFTLTFAHCSEYAAFRNAKAIRAGVLPACGKSPCAMESTAKGFNEFRDEYIAAKEGDSLFKAHFYSWVDDPTCVAPVRNAEKWHSSVAAAVEAYGLTPEQGQFYQDQYEKQGRDVDKLRQEWPLNDVEAFLASGRCFFDMDMIQRLNDLAATQIPVHAEAA